MTTSGAGLLAADQLADVTIPDPALETADAAATEAGPSTTAADTTLLPADVDAIKASIQSYSQEAPDSLGTAETPSSPLVNAADDSYYWDTTTMAPLNARSAAAVARLRAYKPPAFPLWDRLPISRRAAVLVLLYADRRGDLRVVLTMRAASLRNYSGHAAFPGGKADTLEETAVQIARREAWEEIGLPLDDAQLPRPFRIEHLCDLPYNLAKTELAVRPCIALLHASRSPQAPQDEGSPREPVGDVTPDEALIPKLDAKEVAAVFSAPFHNFLLPTDELSPDDGAPLAFVQAAGKEGNQTAASRRPKLPPGPWYEGSWMHWHEKPWRMHFFYVPVVGQRVAKPKKRLREDDGEPSGTVTDGGSKDDEQKDQDSGQVSEDEIEDSPGRYKVWGMTARIIVDAAKLAFGENPAFEHTSHFGDEKIIEGLEKMGRLGEKKKPGSELTHEDMKEASKM
ncbi:nudix domain-containing protein [Ophiostoma piceae UAMH 11346]|uniref:Nudix domain-containing protein n=1 Tax=Ophiostoma piceae (strain UAMH 11346) TaxID=1262450 RepID=S3C4W2_OPHP1|nr:nudix domain-containing protein [Ophiostoma piceae UAMH 11346]